MPSRIDRPGTVQAPGPGRVAVIDIGSNSIRLVVYDRLSRSPVPVFNEKVLCGLGRTMEKTGRLNPEGVKLALQNLARFRKLVDGMGVAHVDVLATAAVRDASDGDGFVARVAEETGFAINVLSGEEEARLAAMGVLSGTPGADGLAGDLGGGSLEVVGLDRGVIGRQATLPLGPFRLAGVGDGKPAAIARHIDGQLAKVPWIAEARGRAFYPVGGNWRALAKMHMEQVRHPLHVIHDYTVPSAEIMEFAGLIGRQSRSSLEKIPGISKRRVDTLPLAALVMERLLAAVRPERVVFSAHGLREGHLFDLLSPEEQRRDPLLAACRDVAERLGRFGQADILSQWVAPLFVGEDEAASRLRQAACLLSDLGWIEHPDYRAEHGFLRILRMPFGGVDHADRAFLALSVYVRYSGTLDGPLLDGAKGLVPPSTLSRANILGLALRLAHTLTGGAAALLQRTALRLGEDALVLSLPEETAMLSGEVVQRRLDSLAKALNRTGRTEVLRKPRAVG